MIINRNDTKVFTTKDGSLIREIMAYRNSPIKKQSLAEATVMPGEETAEHIHSKSEEIYYILEGTGIMTLDSETYNVKPLDAIAIPPGTPHKIKNTNTMPLVLLCCCAPPYEDDDTDLL